MEKIFSNVKLESGDLNIQLLNTTESITLQIIHIYEFCDIKHAIMFDK